MARKLVERPGGAGGGGPGSGPGSRPGGGTGAGEAGSREVGSRKSGAGTSGAGKPGARMSGAGKPGAGKRGAGKPGAGEPGAGTSGARRRCRRGWRARFLSALARCANARLAAAMAGVDHSTAYALRGRDAGFAAAWPRARDWGRARVKADGRAVSAGGRPRGTAGADRREREDADRRPLVVRVSKNGGSQFVRAGEGRWTPAAETIFFAWRIAGHSVRRSAAKAGFSANSAYARRLRDPRFAERWAETRAQAIERNELLMIDAVQHALDPEAIEMAEDLPKPTIREALSIVRHFAGADGGRRGRAPARREPSSEEVRDEVIARIAALRRHREGGGR